MSFANSRHAARINKQSLRKMAFLDHMDAIIPWKVLIEKIDKKRPNYRRGRWKIETKRMLKIYFLQLRYNLSDPGIEEEVYDRLTFQKFLDIDITTDRIPDESTVLRFRHFLEQHQLQEVMFQCINEILENEWLLLKEGTTVDATIIAAPSSTKNKAKKRDPEMHSTRKGNNYYFWMKTHVWTDSNSWLIHTVECTSANIHDSVMVNKLLHWGEQVIYGDSAYMSQPKTNYYESLWVAYNVCKRSTRNKKLSQIDRFLNCMFSRVRARGEWAFGVIKNIWKQRKVKYRWIYKNHMQRYMLAWLSNLYMVRKKLSTIS